MADAAPFTLPVHWLAETLAEVTVQVSGDDETAWAQLQKDVVKNKKNILCKLTNNLCWCAERSANSMQQISCPK